MTSRSCLPSWREPSASTAMFFLDLPGSRESETIWRIYIRKFGLDPAQQRPQDRDLDRRRDPVLLPALGLARHPSYGGRQRTSSRWPSLRASRWSACGTGRQADACRPTDRASIRAWLPAPARRDAASIAATRRSTDSRALEPADAVALFAQFAECTPAFDSANCANFASHFPFSGTSLKAPLVDPPHHPIVTARRSHVRSNQDHRPRCRLLPQYESSSPC